MNWLPILLLAVGGFLVGGTLSLWKTESLRRCAVRGLRGRLRHRRCGVVAVIGSVSLRGTR